MAKVLVTEQSLDDIGAAIQTKLGTQTTYKPGQMAAAIQSIQTPSLETLTATENGTFTPSAGKNGFSQVTVNVESGGGSTIKYAGGGYFGEYEGQSVTSLSVTLDAAVGVVAVLVLMHRTEVSSGLTGWTLVDSRVNQIETTTQAISIYKKTMTAATESVTVTFASAGRCAASVFYFSEDPNLEYASTLELDSGVSTIQYTVQPSGKPMLLCVSNIYAGPTVTYLTPQCVTPLKAGGNLSTGIAGSTFRFVASIVFSPIPVYYRADTSMEGNNRAKNRAYLYTIG